MPASVPPASANCVTTSDFDIPIATSDPPPEQQQSSPRRSPSLRGNVAKSSRRYRRAATTTPKVSRFADNTLIDTFRDALSDGDLPPPKHSKFKYTFHEPEELPQPPETEPEAEEDPEPLPRASLSPPPELAEKIPPWFRDFYGRRYAFPPENPEDPEWFENLFSSVMGGHTAMLDLLKKLRRELSDLLAEVTLADIEADENLALYQNMLQDIHTMAGTEFARTLTDPIGCWHLEKTSKGIQVQYDPEKGERLREANRGPGASRTNGVQAGLAAAVKEIDKANPGESPSGAKATSPAPESPSHAPSIRAKKRRQERPMAPPLKRPRVFPPFRPAPATETRDDSTLPPSSPIPSLPSSSSPSRTGNSDPAAPPPAPAPVTATTSLASLNLELNFKPSSSQFISDPARPGFLRDDSSGSGALADPLASGDPVEAVEPAPAPESGPETVPAATPAPADPHSPGYYRWTFPKEKFLPWNPPSTIPRRPSEDDIKMAWSPEPASKAEGSKKRARADGEDDDDYDDGDSGIIVPRRTAADAESPFRAIDESVEVEESVSAAIGAAHRAAAKAKAKARAPTKAELQEKEDMAYLRARLQEPHYIQDT